MTLSYLLSLFFNFKGVFININVLPNNASRNFQHALIYLYWSAFTVSEDYERVGVEKNMITMPT